MSLMIFGFESRPYTMNYNLRKQILSQKSHYAFIKLMINCRLTSYGMKILLVRVVTGGMEEEVLWHLLGQLKKYCRHY
jgi:hypothetical protein